ncbi:MAG: N-acetyl-gamma-glutamyl-phosphate reductase [Actinomycetes bacterium]
METVVIGASGYAGGELLRLIDSHPKLKFKSAIAHSKANTAIALEHPFLIGKYDQNFEEFNAQNIQTTDLVFIALPHGESAGLVSQLKPGTKIVDLGADFRLKDSDQWSKYYTGDYAGSWTYGLPEIEGNKEKISNSDQVANPGCYATAIALAFAPLIKHDVIDLNYLTVVAASGTTGAGKKPQQSILASEVMGSLSNYKLNGSHQHIPEIEQTLSQINNKDVVLSFNPILAPMPRGILANCISKIKIGISKNEIIDIFDRYYKGQPFVQVNQDANLQTSSVLNTNNCLLQISVDENTNQITVVSVIDNLIKGASGQAIQNANLMCGWDQTMGLVDKK